MEELKVSIAVPVYNVEQYVEKCVVSLMEQTYQNIEYVFYDDCSPDNSLDIIKEVIEKYPNRVSSVKICKHDVNKGIGATRNDLISVCKGDFLFFIDSDDYLEKDAINNLVSAQKIDDADIVTGQFVINDNERDERFVNPLFGTKEEMLFSMLSQVWHHELCNRLVRKSLFDNGILIGKGINVCEDWQIVPQLVFYAKKVRTIDKITYHYVENPNSITHKKKKWETEKNFYLQEYNSLKSNFDFFKNTSYKKSIGRLLLNRMSDNVDISIQHSDKEFFEFARRVILSLAITYPNVVSKKKLFFLKIGYYPMKFFLFLHSLKTK